MKYYITPQGKKMLEKKITQQILKIRDIQEEKSIAYTASGDGWHDNPGYNQLIQLEERAINELKEMEKQAKDSLVWLQKNDCKSVQINTIVKIAMQSPKDTKPREMLLEIVGHNESELTNKKMAYTTPIGNAIYEKNINEETEVIIPAGKTKIKILGIFENWNQVK
jgi:transcription elongation factor GreA